MATLLVLSFDFSGYFVGYAILFAIVVLYYLLLSAYVRAWIIRAFTWFLNRFLHFYSPVDTEISVGSIAFAFLSGKVYANHVRYRTANMSALVLQVTVRWNWWYIDVREGEKRSDERLPCRLSIECVGVQIVLHHNSATYDHLASLILKHPSVKDKAEAAGVWFHAKSDKGKKAKAKPRIGRRGQPETDAAKREHVERTVNNLKKAEQSIPALYRWFPVTKVSVKTGAVMIGNLKLPQFLVVQFTTAKCIHALTPPSAVEPKSSPHCYFQSNTQVSLHTTAVYLSPNPAYIHSDDIINIKRSLDAEDYFAVAIGAFGRFLSELDSELASMQREGGGGVSESRFIRSYRKGTERSTVGPMSQWSYLLQSRDKRKKQEEEQKERERAAATSQRDLPNATELKEKGSVDERTDASSAVPPLNAAAPSGRRDDKKVREKEIVFECAEMSVDYTFDITTLLSPYDVAQLRLYPQKAVTEAPLTGMHITFLSPVSLRYGPHIDNQRVLLMSYFKPFDYQNQQVYTPRVGQYREHATFDLHVTVGSAASPTAANSGESVLRVAYREASKLREAELARERSGTGWFDFFFNRDSSMHYRIDLLPKRDGTHSQLSVTLNQLTITPSFTKQTFIDAEQCQLVLEQEWPVQWNDVSHWRYNLSFHSPHIYYLSAHLDAFSDLMADWFSYTDYQQTHRKIGGAGLEYFQPSISAYTVSCSDYELLLNANEYNIIDHVNSADSNTHISLRGPDLQFVITTNNTDWKARANSLVYELSLRNVHAHLRLPLRHPLSSLCDTGLEAQMFYATNVSVRGNKMYHYKYNADYRDSHSMVYTMDGVEVELAGHYVRYFLSLYNNYVGDNTHHLSSADFVLAGYRNIASHVSALKRWESNVPLNAYETYITLQMENVTVNLPDHLFATSPSHQPKLRWYDTQIELRSVQQYTDVFLSLSPVTLTVPLASGMGVGGRWESGDRERGWNEKETSVQMVGFVLSYHSSKGDPPRSIVYRSSMKLMLDELNAQLLPSQLACLLSSLSAVTQQYADAADYNQPPVSTSTLMPTIDSNNDTLELITAKKQLTSHLQDLLNTALADSTIELAVGCIKLNLLHPPPPKATGPAARLSLTRLLLSEGAQLSSSTLITPLAHSKRTVEVPTIELSHLISNDTEQPPVYSFPASSDNRSSVSYSPSHSATSHWVSLAEFRCGVLLTVADQRADCVSTMRKQQDFIYSQMHQEAAGDENEQYSWHEQNATKVPYMYNDELAAAGGTGAGAMPLFSVTQAVSEGYGLGVGGVGGAGGVRHDVASPMLGLGGLEQPRQNGIGLGEMHSPQLHSPVLQSPSHLFSPPMGSPLHRDVSQGSVRSDVSGSSILPPTSLIDRLRSHAQKRSVQIARTGLVVPRPSHHALSDKPPEAQEPTTPDDVRPNGVTFHRRPSLMASVAFQLDSKPTILRRLSRRTKSKMSLLRDERKEKDEEEEKQLEPAVTVLDDNDEEDGETEEVSRSSFESCQSFSQRAEAEARELSRLASSSSSRDAGDETWQEFREEGQPQRLQSVVHEEREEGQRYPSRSPSPSASASPLDEQWRSPYERGHSPYSYYSTAHSAPDAHIPPLPLPTTYTSCLPSFELQQYLEHYSLSADSHSFVQRKLVSSHAASHVDPFNTSALASALSPSAAPHSVLSMDADLAGTTAGAYLILPTASFQPRDFSAADDGQWYSPAPVPSQLYARSAHFATTLSYDDLSHHHHRMRPTTLDQMHRDQSTAAPHRSHLASPTDAYYRDDLDEQENPTFTNTRHVMIDAIQDVALTITPEFVASLDHYVPLIQASHASIEDTLDELHLQFSRVFSSDAGEELSMALAREKPFTARSNVAVSIPSVSMELLQSAPFASAPGVTASSLVYSTILCVDALSFKQTVDYPLPEGFGSANSASSFPSLIDLATPLNVREPDLPPQLPSTERALSFTRLHLFSSLLNPSVHLSSPSSPLLPFLQPPSPSPIAIPPSDLAKALPADLLTTCLVFVSWEVGATSLHFTQVVDVVLHDEPASFAPSAPIGPYAVAGAAGTGPVVPSRTGSGRSSQLFTFEPNSVPSPSSPPAAAAADTTARSTYGPPTQDTHAVSSSAIEVIQPPVAAQVHDIRWKQAQANYTELSPVHPTASGDGYPYLSAPMSPQSVIYTAVEERKVNVASASNRGSGKGWLFTNLFTPSTVLSTRPQYADGEGESVEMTRLETGQAGGSGGGGRHRRRPSNMSGIEEESEDVVTEEKDDDSKEPSHTSESRTYESEVRDKVRLGTERRVSSADVSIQPSFVQSSTPSASISRPNTPLSVRRLPVAAAEDYRDPNAPSVSYHHHRRIAVTVQLNNVRVLIGRDAPQRLTTLLQTWYTASQQLELLRMMNDSSQLDKHDKEAAAGNAHQPQWPQCLTPLLPGGPSTIMRRYRWQSVLSFALQHLQHSRVLEGQRNANMAFTEQDQVHLLQWYHYQIMRSIKKLEEGRWSSLMHDVSEDKREMLRRDRDELLALLAQYGCTEEVSLPPAFRPASLALANRTVMLPNLPPSALAPHLHAILQHNTLQSDDVNFIMSTALTLTLAMRKLLRLPVALQRRLNFKLQRLDANPQSSAASSPSTSLASELDPHLDYSKLFQPDKLRTSQLALFSLRTFASLAPQAAKVQAVYGYVGLPIGMWRLHLSPALWWVVGERISSAAQNGSRFDERHKVRLDQEDKHVEVDVNNVLIAVVEPNTDEAPGTSGDEGGMGEVEGPRKDHTIMLSSWIMHAHSISTPRFRPDNSHTAHIAPTPVHIAPTPHAHGTPYQATPAVTPVHAPSNPPHTTWNVSVAPTRPSVLSTAGSSRALPVAQSLTPVRTWVDPLSPQRLTVVHEHELVRVKDVVLAMDCQQLSVEFSPSLHHFLSSITQQVESMQRSTTKLTPEVRMAAGHSDKVPPPLLSSLSMTAESASNAAHVRPRSVSYPPVPTVPVLPPPLVPATQSNNIYLSSVFGPPPIFVTHFHLQLSLSSLGFRVRMPNTGSILLSTGSVAVAVSRFIPSLGWEKETAKRGKGKGRREARAKQQHGSAQKAAADYRTGSLRKDREEKKHDREVAGTATEKVERESEVIPHPPDYPLTSCTLKLDALDMRLLDAESVDVPLATLVASALEGNTEAGKRIRESVLTSLITQNLTISAIHASDTSPLVADSAAQTSHTQATAQPLMSTRPSLQRPLLSTRNSTIRRSLFLQRPNTGTASVHPAASMVVVANCDQSVLTLPFYELESLYFADYLGPWRPTIDMLSASRMPTSAVSAPPAASSHLPTRVTAQLSSASLVMLPLPSVMITYHVDRLWSKVITPRQDELHLLLSVGEQNRATDVTDSKVDDTDKAASPRPSPGGSTEAAVSALPVNSHKLTLHSANVRKRKDVAPAKSGHHTRRPTAFQQPTSLASLSSLSSSYGGLGAVLYSRMQFVLDFSLPTVRTSLTIKKDADQQTWRFDDATVDVRKDGKDVQLLDPAVAAALMRLSSEQTAQDDTDEDDSEDDLYSYDSDDSSHSRVRGAVHNRDKEYPLFTAQQAAEIRVVDGVIAVGAMSNQLNENVLNRLLHLQATLNTELNQLIDKVAHYTRTVREGAAESKAGSGRRNERADELGDEANLLDRYCFHVSVVLDDVHLTAGLDANKKTHRNRRTATSFAFASSTTIPSSLSALPQPGSSANVYFDSSWDPMIVVKTGTVSFSVRYTPHAYRLYKQHRQLIHRRQHQRRISRAFGSSGSMDLNAQPAESHHLPVARATSSAFDAVLASDIVIELNCYGAGLELTTSGRERYDAYTLVIAQQPRRALTQLSSHIALTLGLDMEQEHVAVKLSLHQPLMKLTAVSPLIGSAHALADRYGSAYQHYQREAAKLKAEEEYSDPLQGLKQLQAAVGHGKPTADKKPAASLTSLHDSLSPSHFPDRSPFSPLPSSEASVAHTRPNLIPDAGTGNLARVLSLLDTLRDTTRYHLLLAMEDSEIVILFEKPAAEADEVTNESAPDGSKRHFRAVYGDESGRGSSSSIGSVPPSPGASGMYSSTSTPMYQPADGSSMLFSPVWSLDGGSAPSPTRPPETARMTAVVLSLEQFRLHTDYVPAAAAGASGSGASSNASSTFTSSSYSSSFPAYRPVYARQPTNVLHAEMSGEGLELGFLTNIPETNNLKQLAAILLHYREAVTPPPIQSGGSNSRPSSVASAPTRLTVVHSSTGQSVDDGDEVEHRRYLYNRLLVRNSSLSMQASLPVVSAAAVLNRMAAAGAAAVGRDKGKDRSGGPRSITAHQRNLSVASSVASGASYLSSSSAATASNVITRDITVQIHTESSGCEIDIDPSLVHHAYDTSALIELLSSVSQEALDEHWTQQPGNTPPPSRPLTATDNLRMSVSPPVGRSRADRTARSSRPHSTSPVARRRRYKLRDGGEKRLRRRGRPEGRRRTSRALDEDEDEVDTVDQVEGVEGGRRRRFRFRNRRLPNSRRRYSYSSSSLSSSSDDDGDDRQFDTPPSTPGGSASPSSPPPATSPVSSLDIITKTDVVVEIEVNILQGRLCLHSTPPPARKRVKRDTHVGTSGAHATIAKPGHMRHVSVDSGLSEWTHSRLRSPAVAGGSGEYGTTFSHMASFAETLSPLSPMSPSTSAVLYSVFMLPSIVCTYVSQHNVRTEHVLMVELTVPPLSISPNILQFFDHVDVERQKATSLRRSQQQAVSTEPLSPVAPPPKRPGHHRHVSIASNASRGSAALSVASLGTTTGAAPASSLYSFLSDSSLAQRAFTITLRVRPASLSFRCSPSNEWVFLKVGTNRPFDVAVTSATFQLSPAVAGTVAAPSLPAITVTAHLASMYVEMGSDEPNVTSQFLYVRLHHARLHFSQAYNVCNLNPSQPCRTAVFSVDHLAPGKVNVSSCSNLLIFMRSWSLDQYAANAQAASTAPSQPAVDESAAVSFQPPAVAPLPSEPQPMLYLLLSIGKMRAEANMLDIENVNNRAILSLTRFSLRCVDLGGLPAAPRPFLLSAEMKEIHLESQPDLDGLEGTLMCQKGVKVRLLRLPLAVAPEVEEDGEEEREAWLLARRRRRRTRSFAADDDSDYSDYAPSPSGYYDDDYLTGTSTATSLSLHHKRMVNKLECVIQPVHLRFAVAGGRVELLKGHTSLITVSVQDQFYPTAPLELFDGRRTSGGRRERNRWSGRWVTQSDIDIGERLVLGASSHAIPYFIDIITLLFKFLQREISKHPVQPPSSMPSTRPATADTVDRGRTLYSEPTSPTDYSLLRSGRAIGGNDSEHCAMIDDGSGNLRLTGRMIRVELNTEDERDRAVASLVEYSLSLTKECETKPIDPSAEAYHLLSPADVTRGEKETLRVLLLDVGKHRLDEDNNNYEYLPIPSSRPYVQGVFLSRLTPPSDDREVVRVPGFVLEMETLEYQWSDVIRSRLLTFWDKAMTVSVDVRHYKFMQALVSEFVEQYNTAVANVHQQAKDMRETAKRAVDQQHRASIASARGSRHLQLPTPRSQQSSEALSPRSVKFRNTSKLGDQLEVNTGHRGRAATANLTPGIVVSESGKVDSSSGRSTMIKSLFHRKPDSPVRLYHKDDEEEKKEPATTATAPYTSTISTTAANAQTAADSEADGKDETKEGDKIKPALATSLTIDPSTQHRTTAATSDNDDSDGSLSADTTGSAGRATKGTKGGKSGTVGGEKHIDVMGVVEFNPQIHVLDNTSSGISSRKVLELLGMKGDLSIIPQSTHQLTMLLDTLMEACHGLSRAIDRALE